MAPSLQKRLHRPASRVCQRVRTLKRSQLTSSDPPHLLALPHGCAMLCRSPGGAEISWLAVTSALVRVSQLRGGFWEKVEPQQQQSQGGSGSWRPAIISTGQPRPSWTVDAPKVPSLLRVGRGAPENEERSSFLIIGGQVSADRSALRFQSNKAERR